MTIDGSSNRHSGIGCPRTSLCASRNAVMIPHNSWTGNNPRRNAYRPLWLSYGFEYIHTRRTASAHLSPRLIANMPETYVLMLVTWPSIVDFDLLSDKESWMSCSSSSTNNGLAVRPLPRPLDFILRFPSSASTDFDQTKFLFRGIICRNSSNFVHSSTIGQMMHDETKSAASNVIRFGLYEYFCNTHGIRNSGTSVDSKCVDISGCSQIEKTANRINVVRITSIVNTRRYPNTKDPKTPSINDDIIPVLFLTVNCSCSFGLPLFVVVIIRDVQSMTNQP
mmetsp:Transcript_46790/g.114039  ORF Transcript_46790/g.114039 Transcript_46790/m.114039 type:complete len:280 (-) Transcript_46790:2203-3042(-)